MSTYNIQYPNTGVFDGYLQFEACMPGLIGVWYSAYVNVTDGPIGAFVAVFPPGTSIDREGNGAIYLRKINATDPPINDRIAIESVGTYTVAYRGLKTTPKLLESFYSSKHSRRGNLFFTITDWDFGPGKTRPADPEKVTLVHIGVDMPIIIPLSKGQKPCGDKSSTQPLEKGPSPKK